MTYWVVMPAGGVGARMGGVLPKQYLSLLGKPIIRHSLERLLGHPRIAGVVVAVAAQDSEWEEIAKTVDTAGKPLLTARGGAERYHSVVNGLEHLAGFVDRQTWVLVHDAIRPCIRHTAIDRLIEALVDHPVGGLLGIKISDTVKRVDASGQVMETLDRDHLWQAQTPQMFRLGPLIDALSHALEQRLKITDEAAAMALIGALPLMVEGDADNIKITCPPDLALARFYLSQQEAES